MFRLIILLLFPTIISCAQVRKRPEAKAQIPTSKPFELIVYDADYSMAYALQYILTEQDLHIVYKGDLEGEKDTTIFKAHIGGNDAIKKLTNINIDSLKTNYYNTCISDGSQITVKLTKGTKSKRVHLANYYQADIGFAIELINSLVPENYKIWYDKKSLLNYPQDCIEMRD